MFDCFCASKFGFGTNGFGATKVSIQQFPSFPSKTGLSSRQAEHFSVCFLRVTTHGFPVYDGKGHCAGTAQFLHLCACFPVFLNIILIKWDTIGAQQSNCFFTIASPIRGIYFHCIGASFFAFRFLEHVFRRILIKAWIVLILRLC